MWLSFSLRDSSLSRLIIFHSTFETQHGCHFLQETFSYFNYLHARWVTIASTCLPLSQWITSHPNCGHNCLCHPLTSKQGEGKDCIPSIHCHMLGTEQVYSKHSLIESTCPFWTIFFLEHFHMYYFLATNPTTSFYSIYCPILGAVFKYLIITSHNSKKERMMRWRDN